LCFHLNFCVLPWFRTNRSIFQNFVTQMVIWSWSCVTRPFIRTGRLSIGDYKRLLGAGAYNLQSISVLRLNKVWLLEIIVITFTQNFIPYFKILTPPHMSTLKACVQGTCSENIRFNTFGMQKFTKFYEKFAYYGLISDFSTSSWFLFVKLISWFQIWFQWFRPGCTRFHRVSDPSPCTVHILKTVALSTSLLEFLANTL